jgi:flagellar hook-associated protein 2
MAVTTTSNTSTGLNSISGLASGLDWQSIISQLKAVEHQPIDLVELKQTKYENQLKEWQSFNTTLLALKTAADGLSAPDNFSVYTSGMTSDNSDVDATDLLSVNTSSTAAPGSYLIQINSLATAQKLSSASFSSFSEALGSSYAGDIIINGRVISVSSTDGLDDIRNRINNANSGTTPTGVTASIISYGANDYRLILTSNKTGEDGIGLLNGSSSDLVQLFGWKDNTTVVKNIITGGAQSDAFSSSTQAIKTLLGLSSTQSGTVQIAGQDVAIDLSVDSLDDIKTKIDSLSGVSASIVTNTEDGNTTYTIQIDGTQTFTDSQNILQSLGIVAGGISDVQGTVSLNKMTSNGSVLSSSSLLANIDGYGSWTSGDSISISGLDHSGNSISSSFTITSSSTVQNLLEAVRTAFSANGNNVSARITSDGKIEVDDLMTGTSSLTVTLNSTITDGSLDWGTFGSLSTSRKREIIAGQDASLTVDGQEMTSKDNTVEDVLQGVTLNLQQADAGTVVTLNIERDVSAITKKIQSFVTAYNAASAYITKQQTYDTDNKTTGGVLFGDGTLSSIKTELSSLLVESISGVSSDFSILGMVGINLDNDGQLSIDSSKLTGYLKTNFNDVEQLFSANGTSDAGAIEYISSSNDTKPGTYAVNITQVATKNSSTSDTVISGTLGTDETLTITNGEDTASISLTSGMAIADIINAVNTEMDKSYTEKLTGSTAVMASGVEATSTTTWSAIDGANLVSGDKINFTGTARNGSSVQGSYTIGDVSTDTIQDILTDIQSVFDNNVLASIDDSGNLVLTDKKEGSSKLSLSFDYSETTNSVDIFGTVLTTNDGGQDGRYAMAVTAANDGSNRLTLSSDNFGSGNSFTLSESSDTGLWTGSMTTPISVNNGTDVAGTINGEAATGSGQNLTGNTGETNVAGLVLKYTDSATGNVGNIKFTVGVAELFDRTLFNITDATSGYLTFKTKSLSESIKNMDTNITDMESRLNLRMNAMTAKFQAMELALSKFQSMSSWLTGQLTAASSGWQSL